MIEKRVHSVTPNLTATSFISHWFHLKKWFIIWSTDPEPCDRILRRVNRLKLSWKQTLLQSFASELISPQTVYWGFHSKVTRAWISKEGFMHSLEAYAEMKMRKRVSGFWCAPAFEWTRPVALLICAVADSAHYWPHSDSPHCLQSPSS